MCPIDARSTSVGNYVHSLERLRTFPLLLCSELFVVMDSGSSCKTLELKSTWADSRGIYSQIQADRKRKHFIFYGCHLPFIGRIGESSHVPYLTLKYISILFLVFPSREAGGNASRPCFPLPVAVCCVLLCRTSHYNFNQFSEMFRSATVCLGSLFWIL